jgi:hypothetical protein
MLRFVKQLGLSTTMLVFFIHGVATRDVQYADKLKSFIKEEFTQRDKPLPQFYSSFWGDVLNDVSKMWNWIHQDLQEFKKEHHQADLENIFRYKKFREGFLSDFVGDVLTYLNPERGLAIRKLLAQQLYDFLKKNPEETELHIIAHSLGSVILWDVLFSDRFSAKDPAYYIRAMIDRLSHSSQGIKVGLKSITTMGSPILFLNTMLDIRPEKIKKFVESSKEKPFRWINIIHSSDIVAYPIRSSLNLSSFDNIYLRDEYISTDANLAEKTARAVGQLEAAMAVGVADAHGWYWHCQRTASLVTNNIFGDDNYIQKVINRLSKVVGMTLDPNTHEGGEVISFRDGSGTLRLFVNFFKVHHVYVFNTNNKRQFGGYLGVIDIEGLMREIDFIKNNFC